MERGLLWFPLLIVFFGLAWAGWYEYQRVEAYRRWASAFERAKYDVRAVLGQSGDCITWGLPTRGEPAALESFSLQDVRSIALCVDGSARDRSAPLPERGTAALAFELPDRTVEIPFTDITLAAEWRTALDALWQETQSQSSSPR